MRFMVKFRPVPLLSTMKAMKSMKGQRSPFFMSFMLFMVKFGVVSLLHEPSIGR
jgi:hypothetical protein